MYFQVFHEIHLSHDINTNIAKKQNIAHYSFTVNDM